jgi:hypothetical protein
MPPHPNHPCNRCGGQFGDDEAMYMTAVYQPRFRNRIRTAPTCERCLDDDEREAQNYATAGRVIPALDVRQGMSGAGRAAPPTTEAAADGQEVPAV